MLNLAIDPEPGRQMLASSGELGEVFTRRWVVDLILDLAGYTSDRDLGRLIAVEPSCGDGAFLGPMVDRLLQSAKAYGHDIAGLAESISAFDLVDATVERAHKAVVARLIDAGLDNATADRLAGQWVKQHDFLLCDIADESADFVIGNPPYIRLENVPTWRTEAYRRACPTMRGRSDVYVGFIERGLRSLRADGRLGFIVADRWMHNEYGAELRRLITSEYSVDAVIEMHDVDAFEDDVSAYPAVVVISNRPQHDAVVAQANARFGPEEAERLQKWTARGRARTVRRTSYTAARLTSWFSGGELWPAGDPAALALVRDLERRFPPLQDASTGTRVGIGVATGADSAYITRDTDLVEHDRLLPLVTAGDITTGKVSWTGSHLVNPWDDGRLVDLVDYPRLRAHYLAHGDRVRDRHVARRRPDSWFRTIDRVDPRLLSRPKLLLPDIKGASHPVLEDGALYPHHNLYYVVSDAWDLEVLGGLLLSDVANLFVGAYCVKMRGGCYRFQAQYIRRIRVPDVAAVDRAGARDLRRSFRARDREAATAAASRLFGLEANKLPTPWPGRRHRPIAAQPRDPRE